MSKSNYVGALIGEGIAESRAADISDAIDKLHFALSKCDFANRRKFFDKNIETRLRNFAKCAEMSDVTNTGRISGKATYCYNAPKDNKGIRIEIITQNDPKRKILCDDMLKGKLGTYKTFPTWDEACIYSMKKNLENGLLADDVTKIIESSQKAQKNAEITPVSETKESLFDKVQFTLKKLAVELIQEKVGRGLSREEVSNVPLLVLAQEVSNEFHAFNAASTKKEDSPSKTVLLLEDVTSALIDSKVKAGMSIDDALKIPVVAKVEAFRTEYYGINKVLPHVVTIQKDQDGEYRVPGPAGKEEAAAYYTDDKEDALGTAKSM